MLKTKLLFTEIESFLQNWLYYKVLIIIRAGQTWLSSPVFHNFGEKKKVLIKVKTLLTFLCESIDLPQGGGKKKKKEVQFLKAVFKVFSKKAFSMDIFMVVLGQISIKS